MQLLSKIPGASPGLAAVLWLAVGTWPATGEDGPHLRGLPPADGPVQVAIAVHVIDFTDVNEKEETIGFEGAIRLNWMDPRLAYDPRELGMPDKGFAPGDYRKTPQRIYQGDFAVKEVFPGWRPHVVISNAVGGRDSRYMAIGIYPDGMVYYVDYFHASVETPMNLRRFPFDRQELKVYLHPAVYRRDEVLLVMTDTGIASWEVDQGIADWRKLGFTAEERPRDYASPRGTRTVSELEVSMNLARRPGHILFGLVLPLLILVSLTWSVFWMDEESISNRINISLVGILSVVAYYFVIQDSVPRISYLSMMDAFMIGTFLLLAASVVISIVVDKLNRAGRRPTGDRVDRVCRWAFPTTYVVLTALIVILFTTL